MALHALNLCDGYGGFSRALAGFGVRTVARVERDSYAAAVLVERMEQARLDLCPVWDDLTTFNGSAWRGRVDIVTAGFPCQPFSAAGQRLGLDDDRWLWPFIADIVRDVEPRFVILENVPGIVRAGLAEVLHDLARLGFDAEWGLYSAADVGAPHRRERFWLVAHASSGGFERGDAIAESADGHASHCGRPDVGDTGRATLAGSEPQPKAEDARWSTHRDHVADSPNEDVVNLDGSFGTRLRGGTATVVSIDQRASCNVVNAARLDEREPHEQARTVTWHDSRQNTGGRCWPPGRDDTDGWERWITAGGPQPVLRRDSDGPPNGLADALHLGGNGLVPQAATEAIRQLLDRAGWSLT